MRYLKGVVTTAGMYKFSSYKECELEPRGEQVGGLILSSRWNLNDDMVIYIPETHYAFNFGLLYWQIDDKLIRNNRKLVSLDQICDVFARDIRKEVLENK